MPGESARDSHRATREMMVRDDFIRLMYVEYEPTWEWRFIKEVFHRDKLVGMRGFRTFLRSSDPKVRETNELFLPSISPERSAVLRQRRDPVGRHAGHGPRFPLLRDGAGIRG